MGRSAQEHGRSDVLFMVGRSLGAEIWVGVGLSQCVALRGSAGTDERTAVPALPRRATVHSRKMHSRVCTWIKNDKDLFPGGRSRIILLNSRRRPGGSLRSRSSRRR